MAKEKKVGVKREKQDYFGDYNQARSPFGAIVVLLVRLFRLFKSNIHKIKGHNT